MNEQPQHKISFWTKFFWFFLILFISVNVGIQLTGNTYLYKTLFYRYPDIDDLNIFDSRIVPAPSPQELPVSTLYNKEMLPAALRTELEKNESTDFLVLKNDSIRYEQYWDPGNVSYPVNSFSMAKSIVSLLVGIAAADGVIQLEDPVGKYIPEYAKGTNAELKIIHLLTMSSGLNWDESYNSLFSPTTEAYYGSDLRTLISRLQVIEPPGKKVRYMSCNTVLLGMIIQKATGKNVSTYASEKLWGPIGAMQPAFWSLDHHDGDEKSYCCFYSNARDFARIGKLVSDSGRWNGKQIVPAGYLQSALTPNNIPDETGNPVDYYGYGWWLLKHRGKNVFYARGILGQYLIAVPEDHLVIVRLGKKRSAKLPSNHYQDMMIYLDGAMDLWGNPVP